MALLVEDFGHGIPADILAHVFEPFFTTTGPGTGTGRGPPTVDGIVQQGGGYVAIDTAPGIGTTITIDLLLADIVMPDMTGPQFAQHVATMHPKIRVRYVSGLAHASALGGQALSARVSFLPKPFTPGTLLARVREALDAWRRGGPDTNVWAIGRQPTEMSVLASGQFCRMPPFPNDSDGLSSCRLRTRGYGRCWAVTERAMRLSATPLPESHGEA